ncbi:hypothetical protein F2Q69_00025587 [Brassica cretica]|uniref:Uncharacterized protein n=1 Tax=Brassica cretica TaxID=69181 RepID=A0A8S9S4A5_BRACR|nr:hypothetical protein F2Q69_00025587 [Brassica cretica]
MGAAEARALWQRTSAGRCFVVHEDSKMAPRLASCHHHQRSSSGNTEKGSFSSGSFGDFSCDTKWWLKGSSGFDEEIANTFFEDATKCKKLHEFVDLIGIREQEVADYSFMSKNDIAATPWWRSTTDKDELALLVATRSLDYNIQNCDLPPPQKLHKRIHCTSGEKEFKTLVKSPCKQVSWGDPFERSLSSSGSTESKNTSPKSSLMSDDLSKAQILEALRHSQTRAREAEKTAREACAEKELVMTIFLRQASHLLAYKEWLKLLEMEANYRQMKKEEEEELGQIKGVNLKKRKQRGKKNKMVEIGRRYMVAFALGFSLIGAGLFLGWTVGCLFPF